MTDKKWADIKRVMMRDHKVLDQELEEEEGGSIHKETLLVQGSKGVTKFTRFTRRQIYEDPMDWSNEKDWLLCGHNIVSRLDVERQDPETQEWESLDIKKIIK